MTYPKVNSIELVGHRFIVLGDVAEGKPFRVEVDTFDMDDLRILGSSGLDGDLRLMKSVYAAAHEMANAALSIGRPWPLFDPLHGDEKPCFHCGHPYYRHFDTYDNMRPVGCKYCSCYRYEIVGHCKRCNDDGIYQYNANDIYCDCAVGRRRKSQGSTSRRNVGFD